MLQDEPKQNLESYPLPVLEDSDEEDFPHTNAEHAQQPRPPLPWQSAFDDEDSLYTDEQDAGNEHNVMFKMLRERQGGLPNYHVSAWERRVRAALAEVISFGHKANCWAGLLTYEASCHGKVTRQMSRHVDQNDASYSAKRCTLCHLSMHQCRCARLWR